MEEIQVCLLIKNFGSVPHTHFTSAIHFLYSFVQYYLLKRKFGKMLHYKAQRIRNEISGA